MDRYMRNAYGPRGAVHPRADNDPDNLFGRTFAVWGNYRSEEEPERHLTLDGKVDITKEQSELFDRLGYLDSFGNPHD
jgi:hypothetical protein